MWWVEALNKPAAAGLAINLAGALLLARGLMTIPGEGISARVAGPGEESRVMLRSLCEQRFDATWGYALLAGGFMLQIVGAGWPNASGGWLAIAGVALLFIAYRVFRDFSVDLSLSKADAWRATRRSGNHAAPVVVEKTDDTPIKIVAQPVIIEQPTIN